MTFLAFVTFLASVTFFGIHNLFGLHDLLAFMTYLAFMTFIWPLKNCLKNLAQVDTGNDRRRRKYDLKYYVGCEDKILAILRDKCGLGTDFTDSEILTAMGLAEMYGVRVANGAKGERKNLYK